MPLSAFSLVMDELLLMQVPGVETSPLKHNPVCCSFPAHYCKNTALLAACKTMLYGALTVLCAIVAMPGFTSVKPDE